MVAQRVRRLVAAALLAAVIMASGPAGAVDGGVELHGADIVPAPTALVLWPAEVRADAWRLSGCEAPGGDPATHNRADPEGGSVGLWQVNVGWLTGRNRLPGWPRHSVGEAVEVLADPWVNAAAAVAVWRDAGGRFGRDWIVCSRRLGLR